MGDAPTRSWACPKAATLATVMKTLAELPRPWKGLCEGTELRSNPAYKSSKTWAEIAALCRAESRVRLRIFGK
jgi:hypothetical protein